MYKIALFAYNDTYFSGLDDDLCEDIETKEEALPSMLAEELKKYDYEILEFSPSASFEQMAEQAYREAYKTVIVIDAAVGFNPTFAHIGRLLFKHKIRPIVLVTNFDSPYANVENAVMALGNVWSLEDDSLPLSNYSFMTAYYSYETSMSYSNTYKSDPGRGLERCIFYSR